MRLQAHIDFVLQDRHRSLRLALEGLEAALCTLEAAGGKVGEQVTPAAAPRKSRWSGEPEARPTRVRLFSTQPLRQAWNVYVAEIHAHLDREEAILPTLARGLTTGEASAETVAREVTALMAEHEHLYARTKAVRKAFLSVDPLRRAFARVEAEFEAHATAEDTGVFRDLLQYAESSMEIESTPVMERYREEENLAQTLRRDIASRPAPEDDDEGRGWFSWFKKAFNR